jgi:hypothetical protein
MDGRLGRVIDQIARRVADALFGAGNGGPGGGLHRGREVKIPWAMLTSIVFWK